MPDLPSDPPRRTILRHLERQIAETETIGIYLRLQRDEVRKALTQAPRARAWAARHSRLARDGARRPST
ncbi:hypothetical protein VT52_027560 [Streptomyces malaysiense]|uniref:Uncharacterized protein n=1 Tax=Streptomyces malaysiense TaxID=1428626 RepID=A0A1J4PUC4_9ACTN|nr:hypothetical protein VT52_027560 [Streptomyces malaysiense]